MIQSDAKYVYKVNRSQGWMHSGLESRLTGSYNKKSQHPLPIISLRSGTRINYIHVINVHKKRKLPKLTYDTIRLL